MSDPGERRALLKAIRRLAPALREVIRGAYKLDQRLLLELDVDAVTAA